MPDRLAQQVGRLRLPGFRQRVELAQPKLAQCHVRQAGRGIVGVLNKKPLQPLYGVAQPVSLHVHVGNFQQGRPAPIYRCVGGQVLLVNRDGIVRLFHFTQDIAVKISRARGENRVRDPPGQLHKIRRPAQRLIETFLGKIHRGEQVILLPKPLRGQAFVRKVFEQQPRRTKLLQLKVRIGQKQATVDD